MEPSQKRNRGRPLKWNEPSKLMYLPARFEEQISDFVRRLRENAEWPVKDADGDENG